MRGGPPGQPPFDFGGSIEELKARCLKETHLPRQSLASEPVRKHQR